MAKQDRYEFQYWALSLIGAKYEKKKDSDKGIDGLLYFQKKGKISKKDYKEIVVLVKSGHVMVRDDAPIGVLITLENPTQPMKDEAIGKGLYQSGSQGKFQKLQIITIDELLHGARLDLPLTDTPYRRAERFHKTDPQLNILDND